MKTLLRNGMVPLLDLDQHLSQLAGHGTPLSPRPPDVI
jgi:hypothetical protein